MIHKIYLIIIAFLVAVCGFFYFVNDYRGKKIDTLMAEKTKLNENLTRCKNEVAANTKAADRANDTIGKIKTIVKTVKSPCDCYNSVIDNSIIAGVRGK